VIKLTRLRSVEGYHIDSAGKIGEKASIDSVGKIRVYARFELKPEYSGALS